MTGETMKKGNLENRLTPFGLKMITDSSDKYRKAYKSYAFGLLKKLGGKWKYIAVGGIVGVFVLLYLTGIIGG